MNGSTKTSYYPFSFQSYAASEVKIQPAKVKQSANYKAFLNELNTVTEALNNPNNDAIISNNASGDDNDGTNNINLDDDAELSQRQEIPISDIDPITKQQLENPCRNRICGHVYGMNSVAEALQTNSRMRCPIMGCGNKTLVVLGDLVPDKDLARKLYIQRAQRNKR